MAGIPEETLVILVWDSLYLELEYVEVDSILKQLSLK